MDGSPELKRFTKGLEDYTGDFLKAPLDDRLTLAEMVGGLVCEAFRVMCEQHGVVVDDGYDDEEA
jgi:hypothetical protein